MDDHAIVPTATDETAPSPGIPIPDSPSATADPPAPAPRIRWAAVVWGSLLAVIAAAGLWIVSDSARREDVAEWILSLSLAAGIAFAVLAVGLLLLIAGGVALLRRAQLRVTIER